ncbi:S1C family serine protease [Cryobacterium sp. 1639]|uniref:S1C family serine protease n=1 Tax=Cryobacterium inferilacus TaxID=2866629 RepID=UPI001C73DAAE|nr:trypsin-like peptidase domain-containing protein [Cryobacterium sp. 1639]MBX0299720.1 S1C family serine protease [Cryobacterium sp. 1639]
MSDTTPETPPHTHRPRWRTGDVVAMGLAAALVVGSAGTGLFAATRAVENQVAAASTQADTSTSIPDGRSFGGPPAATGGTESGSTSLDSTLDSSVDSTLDTTAATADQSVGVVVIDTVLSYESAAAAGTGIVLTSDGRILTNNHVVEGATSITVTVVSTGAEYTAEVVGTSATEDLAVLELVDASGLAVADLDSTGVVTIGDTVTGVGNANGTGTLTAAAGTVLDLEQQITAQNADGSDAEDLIGLIEVDADIQSGESGGPLFDADGEVIGVNTAASSGTTDITGYAIPIEDALAIVDAIEAAAATGEDTDTISVGYPAFLGIGLGGSSATTSTSTSTGTGTDAASVAGVIADTPAEAIGLAAGDTITAVDGTTVATAGALSATLAGYEPGDTVTIDWTDAAGGTHSAAATLIAGPVG